MSKKHQKSAKPNEDEENTGYYPNEAEISKIFTKDIDWKEAYPRAIWYAGLKIGEANVDLEPDMVVNDVFVSIIENIRRYNTKQEPFHFFLSSIKSHVFNLRRKTSRREYLVNSKMMVNGYSYRFPDPLSQIINDNLLHNFYEYVETNELDLKNTVEAIIETEGALPRELANKLNVPVKNINNKLKRLRRIAKKYLHIKC